MIHRIFVLTLSLFLSACGIFFPEETRYSAVHLETAYPVIATGKMRENVQENIQGIRLSFWNSLPCWESDKACIGIPAYSEYAMSSETVRKFIAAYNSTHNTTFNMMLEAKIEHGFEAYLSGLSLVSFPYYLSGTLSETHLEDNQSIPIQLTGELPVPAKREGRTSEFYLGLHGNTSRSVTKHREFKNSDNFSSPNFSISAGFERKLFRDNKIKPLYGIALFYDKINKTTIQNDKSGSLYKTKYLYGLRGRLGLEFYDRVSLYGHRGLGGSKPSWGGGMSAHITEHWVLDASYMPVDPSVIIVANNNKRDYDYGIRVFRLGVLYYF